MRTEHLRDGCPQGYGGSVNDVVVIGTEVNLVFFEGLCEAFIVNGIDQRKLIVLHHQTFEDGK